MKWLSRKCLALIACGILAASSFIPNAYSAGETLKSRFLSRIPGTQQAIKRQAAIEAGRPLNFKPGVLNQLNKSGKAAQAGRPNLMKIAGDRAQQGRLANLKAASHSIAPPALPRSKPQSMGSRFVGRVRTTVGNAINKIKQLRLPGRVKVGR